MWFALGQLVFALSVSLIIRAWWFDLRVLNSFQGSNCPPSNFLSPFLRVEIPSSQLFTWLQSFSPTWGCQEFNACCGLWFAIWRQRIHDGLKGWVISEMVHRHYKPRNRILTLRMTSDFLRFASSPRGRVANEIQSSAIEIYPCLKTCYLI